MQQHSMNNLPHIIVCVQVSLNEIPECVHICLQKYLEYLSQTDFFVFIGFLLRQFTLSF